MSDVGKRVRQERERQGLTQDALAERIGVSQVTIQNLESGRNRTTRHLLALARALRVPAEYLESGAELSKPGMVAEERSVMYGRPFSISRREAPVIAVVDSSNNGEWTPMGDTTDNSLGAVLVLSNDPNCYAIRIEGDGFSPRYRHGEFVYFEPASPVEPGDEVLVRTKSGREMIRVYLYSRDGRDYLETLAGTGPEARTSIPEDDIDRFHLLAGSAKKLQHIEK